MTDQTVTAFLDDSRIAGGDRDSVTRTIEDRYAAADLGRIQVFEDSNGRRTDLDYWDAAASAGRGRGRPKLGVTAREVTLLPRHWEWLSRQRGGASAALRRLVDEAQRQGGKNEGAGRDAAYSFMQATCGDRANYEEALRAMYRGDWAAFDARVEEWPADIRDYIARLLGR